MDASSALLTVVIPAYNAEKYIGETLDSVVRQKTSFIFDVLISDDCSTDGTHDICLRYASKYKNISVIRQAKNLGNGQPNPNLYFVATYPKTPFIACLDADDIYLTTDFLQKQVDFLLQHPEVNKTFTNISVFNETNERFEKFNTKNKPPEVFDLHFFLKHTIPICQSSTVFRNDQKNVIPEYVGHYFQCDWLLHIYNGLSGKLGYNDFVGVGYRVHSNNATSLKNSEKKLLDSIRLCYDLKKYLPVEYHHYFKHPLYEMNRLAFFYLYSGRYIDFIHWYFKWIVVVPVKAFNFREQFWIFRRALLKKPF